MYVLRLFILLFCCLFYWKGQAAYTVKGTLNMKGDWQYKVYLATIDKLDDYYSANAEFVINVAPINEDGTFEIKGDNLPDYTQFYRLYLVKAENSEFDACLFVGGEDHNFIHLLLDNESQIEIHADMKTYAPFGDYTLEGDLENQLMLKLGRLVYPSYLFYEIKFPSELRFSRDKLNQDLFEFADTCQSTLVSLAALNNTDFASYFPTYQPRYELFGEELKTHLPKHPYTKDYFKKMRYHGEDHLSSQSSPIFKILSALLLLACLVLLYQNYKLQQKIKDIQEPIHKQEIPFMTPQELRILDLIKNGKTNKEIAGELFIEVSTVKSHINKLYAKLKVKNRREAIEKAKSF